MKVNAVSFNQTRHFQIRQEHKPFIKEIREVYAFTPDERTFCCELTPSYNLQHLYTFIMYEGDPSEDIRNELEMRYCYEGSEDFYMHCSSVDKLEVKECGEFEDFQTGCEHLQGNWPI